MSHYKSLVLIALLSAVLGGLASVMVAALLHLGLMTLEGVRRFAYPVATLVIVGFIPACFLQGEYRQALRGPDVQLDYDEPISRDEFSGSLRWSPRWLTYASMLMAAIAFVAGLASYAAAPPDRYWQLDGTPATIELARTGMLGLAMLAFLALPMLVSGLRVPGSFVRNVTFPDRAGHATRS